MQHNASSTNKSSLIYSSSSKTTSDFVLSKRNLLRLRPAQILKIFNQPRKSRDGFFSFSFMRLRGYANHVMVFFPFLNAFSPSRKSRDGIFSFTRVPDFTLLRLHAQAVYHFYINSMPPDVEWG